MRLGLLAAKSWVGEDSILQERVMRYSVIAEGHVEAYEISAELVNKLPKETKFKLLEHSL